MLNARGEKAGEVAGGGKKVALVPIPEKELERISETFAEAHFNRLAANHGLGSLTTRTENPMTFSNIQAKLTGYTTLTPANVRSKPDKLGDNGLAVLNTAFWVKDVLDVFTANSTFLERLAVVSAILPFCSCVILPLSDHEQGIKFKPVDTAACVVAEAFLLTPAWPIGMVLHAFRPALDWQFWADAKKYWDLKDHRILYRCYYDDWNRHRDKVLRELDSDVFVERVKLEAMPQQIGVIFLAARAAGALRAGTLQAAMTNATEEERRQIESGTDFAGSEELNSQLCAELRTKKKELKAKLEESVNAHLVKQFAQFDRDWFQRYRDFWDDTNGYSLVSESIDPYLNKLRGRYGRGPDPGLKPGPEPWRYSVPLIQKVIDKIETCTECADDETVASIPLRLGESYISGVEVVYGDRNTPPINSVREVDSNSRDINRGFDGKYAWLVPTYTEHREAACTFFDVTIQDEPDDGKKDVARGAGGDFRYLECRTDPLNDEKIRRLSLYRSRNGPLTTEDVQRRFFSGLSININQGRGGDYLYLVFET